MNTNDVWVVFWIDECGPQCDIFTQMQRALDFCEFLRKKRKLGSPISHIVFSHEDPNQVGQLGVDAIKDGKCPDGVAYDWVKRRPAEPVTNLNSACDNCKGTGEEFDYGLNCLDGNWVTCSVCLGKGYET